VAAISLLAVGIGVVCAYVALALLKLIGLFTNLFFYQRWNTALVSPAGHHLGPLVILVPIAGALIIGVMARFGSERIRGHGIPEAIEAILINGSRVEPSSSPSRRPFRLAPAGPSAPRGRSS
jgi:H+/Cl- antiporter ClcA